MKNPLIRVLSICGAFLAVALASTAAQAALTSVETTPPYRTISNEQLIPLAATATSDKGKATITWTFDSAVDAEITIDPGAAAAPSPVSVPASAVDGGLTNVTKIQLSLTRSVPVQLADLKNTVTLKTRATGTGTFADAGTQATFTVYVDTVIPNAPGGISADGADEVLLVTWDAPSKTSDIEVITSYIVTYSDNDFSALSEPEVAALSSKTVEAVGDLKTTLDGLENGKTYYVTVRSVDWVGNVSPFPKTDGGAILTASGQPVITMSLSELAGEKGGCFIATAAYGSYQEPHVKLLRDFRDRILLRSEAGSRFVAWYYRASPAYALWIAKHDAARAAVRVFLLPLYGFAYLMLHPLWALLAGMLLLGIGAARYALPRREVAQ